jgi:hypothetical protein
MLATEKLAKTTEFSMRHAITTALAATLFALSTTVPAQPSTATQDHAAHHPPAAASAASGVKAPGGKIPAAAGPSATMKSMQEMHAKMMAAKTVEERQALMADHMKAMQDGMSMMGQMKGERGGMSSEAMGKRMDMMEMMMQMMMDREAARAPAAK